MNRSIAVVQAVVMTAVLSHAIAGLALAAGVAAATFSGTTGTATVNGTFFARSGAALTLTVVTDAATNCVALTGTHTGSSNSPSGTTATTKTWTFALVAAAGADGVRTTTVTARDNADCTGGQASAPASYTVDNTAPTVGVTFSPTANQQGWYNSDITLTWTASDTGSGVASGPTPATDTQTVNTGGTLKSSTATDRVGNVANRQVVVKLDKDAPLIAGSANPAANANGWNNSNVTVSFTCSDSRSGISSCSGPTTVSANGAGQSVTGNAADFASNTASTTVVVNLDKLNPTVSGAPAGSPNGAGWYNANVSVAWTCNDTGGSGFAAGACANSVISGEGTGLAVTKSVTDLAGNASNVATSSPAVNLDKTPPVTTASPATANGVVTVTLSASDGLSGLGSTSFRMDGGAPQNYNAASKPAFTGEGSHSLEYWSTDNAGNGEVHHLLSVGIDTTPPVVTTTKSPLPNANGWNNTNVTVSFSCVDASGVVSCPASQTVTTEGANQPVSGTAVDTLGNTTTAQTTVSVDKTPPTVTGSASPTANANGWNNTNVTVSFTCGDSLSGVATCPSAQTLTNQGAGQSVSGTATDNAGNNATRTVGSLNIDKTAPTLSGAATTAPNGSGWYRTNVTVSWTCSDALSGLAGACPAASTVSGEGANLSASAAVTDRAGNQTNATVGNLRVDRTAPTTTASVPPPNGNGWYSSPPQVTLAAQDALSGVGGTFYSVDGGTTQTYTGSFSVGNGTHTVVFWSTDVAGNVEGTATGHSLTLRVDSGTPTITGSRAPAPNANGWNNTNVTVTFTCTDAGSGLVSCPAPVTVTTEGANQSVTGTMVDQAGNSSSATVSGINIDKTAPTAAVTGVTPGATYKPGGYTAGCESSGGLSGVATPAALSTSGGPTGPVTLTCSGAVDRAGNSQTAPASVTINVATDPGTPPKFSFRGFWWPVHNRPHVNFVKAGWAVPLKFSLGGNRGMDVLASGYPRSWAYWCRFGPCGERSVPTATNSKGFTYDTARDTYTYLWRTDRSFAGSCRVFEMKFVEGSTASAFFCFW